MRIFNIDPINAYHEAKRLLSEIKSLGDIIDIISEINDLKDFMIENVREGLMESEIYEEHLLIEKLLQEFLLRCEEQVQLDLNALSSHVDGLERTIIMLPPVEKGDSIPPDIHPHINKHTPE